MTNQTELEVTAADMDAAAKVSGFESWEDAVYWSNLAKQYAVQNLAQAFARHRLATRTPDPTPVAWMYVCVNSGSLTDTIGDYFIQTNRANMDPLYWTETPLYTHPPAVTADGLVEVVARAIGTHIMPGSPWEANLRAELAAHRGEA